jgi:hypothetical protein
MRHFCPVSTFNELIVEAERAIRARIDFEADELTGYFVAHGAVLLACLRYWAQIEGKTDAEVQAAIESADKSTPGEGCPGSGRKRRSGCFDGQPITSSHCWQAPAPPLRDKPLRIHGVPVSSVP